MISGAMCAGEPTSAPVIVIRSSRSTIFAIPKSISLSTPSSRTIAFSGFRSRWITPCSCAWASASARVCTTIAAISGTANGWSVENCRSVCPRMYSVTRYASSLPSDEKSNTSRMFGWCSFATAFASRASRLRASSFWARCGWSTFTATSRSSEVSRPL